MHSVIDAHIHLDMYETAERDQLLKELATYKVEALISVSNNLASAQKNLHLSKTHQAVKPVFGYHPEQNLPHERELNKLLTFIEIHADDSVAIGEVGLPYYLRQKNSAIRIEPYIELLEVFIKQASTFIKPIGLHAVYDDAPIVCDLLEKYSIHRAHFHWFKGDLRTIERMITNGYFISVTPDVLYEKEIQHLVKTYPLSQMMVETDGPWPFKGPFENELTHPKMIHHVIETIAIIKKMKQVDVYDTLYKNTKNFYQL